MLVSIDPGNDTGWALWDTELVECGLGEPPRNAHLTTVWIESPVIYPRSPVPPQDIVTLALNAGRLAGRYDAAGVSVHLVNPATWKGQVPKDIHHARIWGRLSIREQGLVDSSLRGVAPKKRHNVMDAIGIGLWALHRSGLLRTSAGR